MPEPGLIHYYFGTGKGKTTASLGLALRMLGHGGRVASYHFMKSSNRYGEFRGAAGFDDSWSLVLAGPPCVNPGAVEPDFICEGCMACHVAPGNPKPEDIEAAEKGLAGAAGILEAGNADLVILDEVGYAVELGLLDVSAVLEAVKTRATGVEVVLTGGRSRNSEFAALADYVTEMVEQTHHYKTGRIEVEGIDF
ncbi:MAG: cob(I)yrinic acid a,c-diamide adenosyltransferase [Planctomycetota bacterium]|nr:MAG: cob(I)yrinic acid a,c-diamide adenosyltransferase [Planctomycetota bacterium]